MFMYNSEKITKPKVQVFFESHSFSETNIISSKKNSNQLTSEEKNLYSTKKCNDWDTKYARVYS